MAGRIVRGAKCLLLAVAALVVMPIAHAGRNCDAVAPDAAKTQKAIRLATQLRDIVDLSGANVVMIGRVGSDQSKYGVRYTHVGYLLRSHAVGAWTVVHALNACGTGESDIFDEGLANFFMDDPFDFEAAVVIPSSALQERLAEILQGPAKRVLHERSYSTIANPWSTRFQNSNAWALEILAAASGSGGLGGIGNRLQAQQWLKANGYQPGRVHIGAGERAGLRLFTPHVRFGDHPDPAWQTQTYEVSTGDAVLEFLRRIDPDARLVTLRLDGRPVIAQKPAAPSLASEPARSVEPAKPPVGGPPTAVPGPISGPAAVPAPAPATRVNNETRGQILQSMQGLIVPYACRPQGYLSQCRQLERTDCEKRVANAILRCFATVSDQQLMSGTEQAAMRQMQELGYCAVEGVDADLGTTGKRATAPQGQSCQTVRNYQSR